MTLWPLKGATFLPRRALRVLLEATLVPLIFPIDYLSPLPRRGTYRPFPGTSFKSHMDLVGNLTRVITVSRLGLNPLTFTASSSQN